MKEVKVISVKKKKEANRNVVNPWLNAKDTWRDKFSQLSNTHLWLMILTTLACLIALGCTACAISTANRSKYIPYVIAVDEHGVALTSGFATQMNKQSDKVISSMLSQFITATRSVTVDLAYLKSNIDWAYAHFKQNSAGYKLLNEWFSGASGVPNPITRAQTEIINVEIKSILKQSDYTWVIEWNEISRNRDGEKIKPDMTMKAIITIEYGDVPNGNYIKGIIKNPLGVYISTFSWAKKG